MPFVPSVAEGRALIWGTALNFFPIRLADCAETTIFAINRLYLSL